MEEGETKRLCLATPAALPEKDPAVIRVLISQAKGGGVERAGCWAVIAVARCVSQASVSPSDWTRLLVSSCPASCVIGLCAAEVSAQRVLIKMLKKEEEKTFGQDPAGLWEDAFECSVSVRLSACFSTGQRGKIPASFWLRCLLWTFTRIPRHI